MNFPSIRDHFIIAIEYSKLYIGIVSRAAERLKTIVGNQKLKIKS